MSIDLGDAPVGTPPSAGEKAQIRAALGFGINDVADNSAKLALTGIDTGYTVRITGEANRVEQYIGGAITDEDSWVLIGPATFELQVIGANVDGPPDPTFNGETIPFFSTVNLGWFKDGIILPYTMPMFADPSWSEIKQLDMNGTEFTYNDTFCISNYALTTFNGEGTSKIVLKTNHLKRSLLSCKLS